MGVGSNCPRAPVDPNAPQCFALEPTAEVASSRRNSAVHYSTHQVFDQLLADQAILMAAPALLDGVQFLG